MGLPLAYFLTWTTKGTRLHGDERGSVVRGQRRGDAFVRPNPAWVAQGLALLKHPPVVLDDQACAITRGAIYEVSTHRGWTVHALSVRATHTHIVLATDDRTPELVMEQLRARSTLKLREAGCFGRGRNLWTPHGSTRYLWRAEDVTALSDYVSRLQDLPARFERDAAVMELMQRIRELTREQRAEGFSES